jgi:hypothetical protein
MRIRALTILCSSFLLFAIQPIVAKAILPWFGGSPAVWTTCLLFFQDVLLVGYAYAHLLARFLARPAQAAVHVALVAATLLLLPVGADPAWQPTGEEDPALRILGLLAASVGLPYLALSSTAPLIQSWVGGDGRAAPYRLYALSNAGSLLALLGYPLGIEPLLTTGVQFTAWSAGYGLFGAVSILAAVGARRPVPQVPPGSGATDASGAMAGARIVMWALLPAMASVMLLAVTNQICQEIAVVPLLWLLPLTLYLVSFILSFESDRWYRRRPYRVALGVLSVLALAAFPLAPRLSAWAGTAVFSAYLFVACMACHGELAALRPPPSRLTLFYLMVALGGAAGGVFVALVAPLVFTGYYELPLGLVLTFVVVRNAREGTSVREWAAFAAFLVGVAVTAAGVAAVVGDGGHARVAARNFYGALAVTDAGDGANRVRTLTHGRTVHGQQYLDPARRAEPLSYYVRASGAGQLLAYFRGDAPRRVGLLGLGAGTLSAYARSGDTFRYYEINPLVVEVAQSRFTYLGDAAGVSEIVVADARVALERERGQPPFEVLLADAFSGDAIPVHLLTREAFHLYAGRLRPDGVLAIHISNRHLDLEPVVAAALRSLGWVGVVVENELPPGQGSASWVLAAAAPATLDALPLTGARPLSPAREIPWRDNFSNLLQVLK